MLHSLIFLLLFPAFACFQELGREERFVPAPPAKVVRVPIGRRETMTVEAFRRLKEIGFATYNLKNLFKSERPPGVEPYQHPGPKPDSEIAAIANNILREKPAVLALQEVESMDALKRLTAKLNGEYFPLLVEGNDGRGIDVAMLVRRDLPLEFEYISHKNEPLKHPLYPERDKVFSRDLTALVARLPGEKEPLFVFMAGHAKSKITKIEADPKGAQYRTAEAERMADLVLHYEKQHPGVPVFIGADFNATVHSDPEYRALRERAGMADAFDLVPEEKRIPRGDPRRVSHTYHPRDLPTDWKQIDAIATSRGAADAVLDAKIGAYQDAQGRDLPPAETWQQQKAQPSDHRPVYVRLDLQKLLARHGTRSANTP